MERLRKLLPLPPHQHPQFETLPPATRYVSNKLADVVQAMEFRHGPDAPSAEYFKSPGLILEGTGWLSALIFVAPIEQVVIHIQALARSAGKK